MSMTEPTEVADLRPGDRILITDDSKGLKPASEWAHDGSDWWPAVAGNPNPTVAEINEIVIKRYGYKRTVVWNITTDRGTLWGYEADVELLRVTDPSA